MGGGEGLKFMWRFSIEKAQECDHTFRRFHHMSYLAVVRIYGSRKIPPPGNFPPESSPKKFLS